MSEDAARSALLGDKAVHPSDNRPTSVLPGRTAQDGVLVGFLDIRPTVLPSSRMRTHTHTRTHLHAREKGRTVGRLDGFETTNHGGRQG